MNSHWCPFEALFENWRIRRRRCNLHLFGHNFLGWQPEHLSASSKSNFLQYRILNRGWYYAIWDAAVDARIMKLATGLRVVKHYCTLLYCYRSSGNDRYGHRTPGALYFSEMISQSFCTGRKSTERYDKRFLNHPGLVHQLVYFWSVRLQKWRIWRTKRGELMIIQDYDDGRCRRRSQIHNEDHRALSTVSSCSKRSKHTYLY